LPRLLLPYLGETLDLDHFKNVTSRDIFTPVYARNDSDGTNMFLVDFENDEAEEILAKVSEVGKTEDVTVSVLESLPDYVRFPYTPPSFSSPPPRRRPSFGGNAGGDRFGSGRPMGGSRFGGGSDRFGGSTQRFNSDHFGNGPPSRGGDRFGGSSRFDDRNGGAGGGSSGRGWRSDVEDQPRRQFRL
jgi:hypothetical protein